MFESILKAFALIEILLHILREFNKFERERLENLKLKKEIKK